MGGGGGVRAYDWGWPELPSRDAHLGWVCMPLVQFSKQVVAA